MLSDDNPFADPSDLPYGLPPFDRIRAEHVMPAFEAGIAAQREEWEAIATDPEPPTVGNTLEALQRSGQLLDRVLTVHFTRSSSVIDDDVRAHDEAIAPALAAHADALRLDGRIFARVDALHDRIDELGLAAEQRRLLERTHLDFTLAGADLDDDDKARLAAMNERLSTLTTAFKTTLVDATTANALHVTDPADLAGLSAGAMASAAATAEARGLDGWLLTLVLPTGQPALASLTDRRTRERLHRAATTRGLGGDHDTRGLLVEIAALRAERAALLGFATHADHVLADQTADDVDAVMATLGGLVGPAVANAAVEAAELEALLHADGHEGPLEPWDWAFYAERVRRERCGVDESELSAYFELERVLVDGILAVATRLYGITFPPRPDLPTYHPDITTYEVFDADGSGIGLALVDPFARDSKRGGAWMTTLSDQSHLLDARPVVTLTLNAPRPGAGQPPLLTVDEVETAFHEFGHALHGLFSDVTYPRFSGTSVPRDFVEFPSQVNEMWAFDPEILRGYAVHHETGEPLDPAAIERLQASRRYGEGFATTEYLAATLLDLAWHRLPAGTAIAPEDVESFEASALRDAGVDVHAIPPRYRSTYFAHIFAGGYAAAYYSYLWSEILDAELVEWFGERGGLRRENGDIFRERLLARGGSVDPMQAFADVRGRPPTLDPLLDRRGLRPREP